MIRALLFDLDGTLLDNDMKTFLPRYFQALTAKMAHIFPPEELVRMLMASTRVMIRNNDPAKTNAQVFWEDFEPRSGHSREELEPLFADFYAHEYRELRACVRCKPEARPLLERALELGYELVIATNPLFPRLAIEERLHWAGIADLPFKLVTSYEDMHFCKPHPGYYQEVLARIGREARECLMTGNSVGEDIAPAQQVGLYTFLVLDNVLDPVEGVEPHFQGSLADLQRLLEEGFPGAQAG